MLSIVAMIALAMIVSICSNVDAFFALSFASTFTPGSIVAFLLVGPLVDIKMLALMRTTFTTRVLVGIVHRGALGGVRDRGGGESPCVEAHRCGIAGSGSDSPRAWPW